MFKSTAGKLEMALLILVTAFLGTFPGMAAWSLVHEGPSQGATVSTPSPLGEESPPVLGTAHGVLAL